MVDVLPRNPNICTRQPVVLKLRKDMQYNHDTPLLKLSIPSLSEEGEDAEVNFTTQSTERVRDMIQSHMDTIAKRENGVVIAQEITVEVRSEGVPTIDLVDLPGLVAVKANQNPQLAALTEQCTENYLKKESTGAVVVVIDAGMDNLRSSNAIKLLQRAPEAIRQHSIGVFSKADKAIDPYWEDEEDSSGICSKPGPLWKLEERILGTADDYKGMDEPYLGVQGGFIAVVNRNTRSRSTKGLTLSDHNNKEMDWKEISFVREDDNIPPVHAKVLECVGLDALVARMDAVICQYLGRDWVPKRLEEIEHKRSELNEKLVCLGKSPEDLNLEILFDAVKTKLEGIFPLKAEQICVDTVDKFLPHPEESDHTDYGYALKMICFREQTEKMMKMGELFEVLVHEVRNVFASCFEEDQTGDIQLCRFNSMQTTFESDIKGVLEEHQQAAELALTQTISNFFGMCCFRPEFFERDLLKQAMVKCLLEFLMVPFIGKDKDCFPIISRAKRNITNMPEEKCAAKRQKYLNNISNLDEIKSHYLSIRRGVPVDAMSPKTQAAKSYKDSLLHGG